MYQLLLRLEAQCDCAWESMYHRKIRGRLGQALDQAGIERYQDTSQSPFAFSDLMPLGDQRPGGDLDEGDGVHLLVGASSMDVLEAAATDLRQQPRVTAGSMVFEARAAQPLRTGVGEVGTAGTLTTASGIVAVTEKPAPGERGAPTYWSDRDHSDEAFKDALHRSVGLVLDNETDLGAPDGRLFDDYDHRKTYGVHVAATPSETITLIASKWDLHYEVRDEIHHDRLNAILGTGVGTKRSYGFGLLQRLDDPHRPDTVAGSGIRGAV